jgi:DNA-binding NarL/FixJ family response regulator
MEPSTRRRPLRVLLADAAPMQRAGLRMALTGASRPPDPQAGDDTRPVAPGAPPPALDTGCAHTLTPSARWKTAVDASPPSSRRSPVDTVSPAPDAAAHADADADADAEIIVVGEAGDGIEAVSLARRLLPDVLVADLALPRADGRSVARAVVSATLPVRVLILADDDSDDHVLGAIAAGAVGFLRKDVPAGELARTVRTLAAGGAVIAPLLLARILGRVAEALPAPEITAPPALDSLTEREREVLVHVARGHSNAEIAAALQVSETTIKTHVGHLLTKLRLRDRTQAVVLAYETGLIKPGS